MHLRRPAIDVDKAALWCILKHVSVLCVLTLVYCYLLWTLAVLLGFISRYTWRVPLGGITTQDVVRKSESQQDLRAFKFQL